MKRGKKYSKSTKGLDREVTYSVAEGVKKARASPTPTSLVH
jgi:hypothetical protein